MQMYCVVCANRLEQDYFVILQATFVNMTADAVISILIVNEIILIVNEKPPEALFKNWSNY